MILISRIINIFPSRKQGLKAGCQDGYILIASLIMLVLLAGLVLICIHPMTYEMSESPRHRKTLRRYKITEKGIFGRLAVQPGGVNSAGGGYISDLGGKMIVEKYVDNILPGYGLTRLSRVMDFWFYRRYSSLGVLTETGSDGNAEGADDIYRYDPATGFWAGYRGKRYLVRPVGEERLREKYLETDGSTEFHLPRFYTRDSNYALELAGGSRKDTFFLKTTYYGAVNIPDRRGESDHFIEHTRYYNPVERLVVLINDRRQVRTPLSALLVYTKQPDPEDPDAANELAPYFPRMSSRVVTEAPAKTDTQENITSFIFRWDPANREIGRYSPIVDIGHTFEIGLKKLILMENDIPVFACGITIPPVREYQCTENDSRAGHHSGCSQPFSDQYVVEIDYDG